MKTIIKKLGRLFVVLKQKQEEDIRQSVLLVDGSRILPNNLTLIIKDVKEKFKNADFAILPLRDKEEFIRNNFPEVKIITPWGKIRAENFPLAIRLLLLRKNFRFIVLSSLDISSVLISLVFSRCPVLLHNRWLEWYALRPRTIFDVLRGVRSVDRNRKKISRGIKDMIKSLGRIFVILCEVEGQDLKSRILIQDNGHTETGYILTAIRKIEKLFINPDITILTTVKHKQDFLGSFPQIKLVVGENNNRGNLAARMYKMRGDKFNYIILTALDIAPIMISFLFFRAKIILYNQWHQWWGLCFRGILGYFKEALILLLMVPVYIYLFASTGLTLLRTGLRLKLKFKSVIDKKK